MGSNPYFIGDDTGIVFIDPKPIGLPTLAWIVIIAMVSFIVAQPYLFPGPADDGQGGADAVSLKTIEFQCKYFVGARSMTDQKIYDSAAPLNTGSVDQRLRFVVLAGELVGAPEANRLLDDLGDRLAKSKVKSTATQNRLRDVLSQLYGAYEAKDWDPESVSKADRKLLRQHLGWFGALALAPSAGSNRAAREKVMAPATRTVIVMLIAMFGLFLVLAGGFVGIIAFIAAAFFGKVRSGIEAGAIHGGVYAETFAVWMLIFLGLSFVASFVLRPDGIQQMLWINLGAFFSSLAALVWPVFRGVTIRRMRQDLGLTFGSGVTEFLWGGVCYVCTVPLLLAGVVLMLILMSIVGFISAEAGIAGADEFSSASTPSHPIVQWIGGADWLGRLQIVLLACVAAPIVEETMFRGVLYRHLRDCTWRWRVLVSVLFSAGLSSFIFAVIHPQGFLAVPPLMALAIGFSLAREWRGSLIAPMTMHALNNGAVTALMFLMF